MTVVQLNYIQFLFSELPASTEIDLGGETYTLSLSYNEYKEFFTLYVFDNEENVVFTTKLVYYNDCFSIYVNDTLYNVALIPVDFTDISQKDFTINKITKENFDGIRLVIQ